MAVGDVVTVAEGAEIFKDAGVAVVDVAAHALSVGGDGEAGHAEVAEVVLGA